MREKHIAWLCYFQLYSIMIGVIYPVRLRGSQTLVIFVGKENLWKKQPLLLGGTVVTQWHWSLNLLLHCVKFTSGWFWSDPVSI